MSSCPCTAAEPLVMSTSGVAYENTTVEWHVKPFWLFGAVSGQQQSTDSSCALLSHRAANGRDAGPCLRDSGQRDAALLAVGGAPGQHAVLLRHPEEVHLGPALAPMLQQIRSLQAFTSLSDERPFCQCSGC